MVKERQFNLYSPRGYVGTYTSTALRQLILDRMIPINSIYGEVRRGLFGVRQLSPVSIAVIPEFVGLDEYYSLPQTIPASSEPHVDDFNDAKQSCEKSATLNQLPNMQPSISDKDRLRALEKSLATLALSSGALLAYTAFRPMMLGQREFQTIQVVLLIAAGVFLFGGILLKQGIGSIIWAVVMIGTGVLDLLLRATMIFTGAGFATIFILLGALVDIGTIVASVQIISFKAANIP